ncbi:MAG TPA: YibE/F family protein, partial [Actinoplanes sp.]|nr:YibE/F family protein [Actinoplanes sp.]
QGSPPLLVAVVGSSAIMFAALYLTHGVNVHTSVAVAGTLISLVLTGVLGVLFTTLMKLTGVAGDDSSYLSATMGDLDLRGLLLAGIVIGALGVLDDVTVTQAFTVAEMSAAGGRSRWQLYASALRVGRAHVASAVNTIVLAYAGASLPLFLVIAIGTQPVSHLLTSEFLAQEIMRSAVGTIGLVASVPITTALAALVADLNPRQAVRA